jgi:hypothetical protein
MVMRDVNLDDPNLAPLFRGEIGGIRNLRTPCLDLNSVYNGAPHADDDRLLLGQVTTGVPPRPPGKGDDFFDIPREGELFIPLEFSGAAFECEQEIFPRGDSFSGRLTR